jgi:beta-lactamase regulating signal transducer with metallopeptidase domain
MISVLAELAGTISRSFELSVVTKATLLLVLGLGVAQLARHARASIRHLVLAVTFAGLLALPAGMALLPPLSVGVAVRDGAAPAPAPSAATTVTVPTVWEYTQATGPTNVLPAWQTLIRGAWAVGVIVLLTSFGASVLRLSRIGRSAIPCLRTRRLVQDLTPGVGITRPVDVLLHEAVPTPLTFGIRRPQILLPSDARDWADADIRRAVIHELEHIHRGDWIVQVAARAACAVYWFHPLAWMAWRQLSLEAERACDDAVVRSAERTEYAEQLVALARRLKSVSSHPLVAMASRTDLSTRVSALLDLTQPRGRAGRHAVALVLPLAAAAVVAIAPMRAIVVSAEGSSSTVSTAREQRQHDWRGRGLVEAADEGDLREISELIDGGADVNTAIDGDGTPLIAASREGHLPAVRLLLQRGADPNLAVSGDGNPLIMAAAGGHTAIVELLLASGASVDQVVTGDENALIRASGEGHFEVVVLLVARGADVNAAVWADAGINREGEWRTPLGMARRGGHAAVEKFLLSKGARQ